MKAKQKIKNVIGRVIMIILAVVIIMPACLTLKTNAATSVDDYDRLFLKYPQYLSNDREYALTDYFIRNYQKILDSYNNSDNWLASYLYCLKNGIDVLGRELLASAGISKSFEEKLTLETVQLYMTSLSENTSAVYTASEIVEDRFSSMKTAYDIGTNVGKAKLATDLRKTCTSLTDATIDDIVDGLVAREDDIMEKMEEVVDFSKVIISLVKMYEIEVESIELLMRELPDNSGLKDALTMLKDTRKKPLSHILDHYCTDKIVKALEKIIMAPIGGIAVDLGKLVIDISVDNLYKGAMADDIIQTTYLSSYVSELEIIINQYKIYFMTSKINNTTVDRKKIVEYEFFYKAYVAAIRCTLVSAQYMAKTSDEKSYLASVIGICDMYTYDKYIELSIAEMNRGIGADGTNDTNDTVDTSMLTTKWMTNSTGSMGYLANHPEALKEVTDLMKTQTTPEKMARFDLILSEYPLSGFFNSKKTSPCEGHCGNCGEVGDTCINEFYDFETGKTVNLYAWQCYGYARYCSYRFFGSIFKNEGTTVSSSHLSSVANFKKYLDSYNDLTGAHFRVNSSHSLVYLARTDEYIYFIDANSGSGSLTGWMGNNCPESSSHSLTCCKINLRKMTYQQFLNRYGSKVVVYHNEVNTGTVSMSLGYVNATNEITASNAVIHATLHKPESYTSQKFGIRIRKINDTYENGWVYYHDAWYTKVGETTHWVSYDLNEELNITLQHSTTYAYQFYGKANGVECWSPEGTFTTSAGAVSHIYKLTAPDGFQTMREHAFTTADKIYDISTPAYVTVTQYNDDGTWGYVTYKGYSGWIKLYYAEKHETHSYGAWNTTVPATCTAAGSKSRTCACGASETQSIPMTGHTWSSVWTVDKKQSCTAEGSKSHHCTNASCTAKTDVTVIPKDSHSYGAWNTTVPATCTAAGSKSRTCACGASETQSVAKTDHSFGEWSEIVAYTCTRSGLERRICSKCSAQENRIVPAAHSEVYHEAKPATCTEAGYFEYVTCSKCDYTTFTEIPSAGHSYGCWIMMFEPDIDSDGFRSKVCSACGDEIIDIIVYGDGDADGDGVLTNSDITIIIRTMSGWSTDVCVPIADTNYDGKITNRDIIALIRKISYTV